MSSRARDLLFIGAMAIVVAILVFREGPPDARLEADRVLTLLEVHELSGIAWYPGRGSLLGVTDEGEVLEISLDGRVQRRVVVGGDLEGIAVDAATGRAVVIDESQGILIELDAESLSVLRRWPAPAARGAGDRAGYEGVAFIPGGEDLALLRQQNPAAVVRVSASDPERAATIPLDGGPLSDLRAAPDGRSFVVLARGAGLRLYGAGGKPLGPWRPLAARNPEGFDLVPGHGLCVCTDDRPSRLHFFSGLDTWESLRQALLAR